HTGNGRGHLLLLAANCLLPPRVVDQVAVHVVDANVTVVAAVGGVNPSLGIDIHAANALTAPSAAVEIAEGVLTRRRHWQRLQVPAEAADGSLVSARPPGVDDAVAADGDVHCPNRQRSTLAAYT